MADRHTEQIVSHQRRQRADAKDEALRLAEAARTGLGFRQWAPKHFTVRPREKWREIRYLMDMAQVIVHPKGPRTVALLKSSQLGYSMLLAAVHAWLVGERDSRVVFALPTDVDASRFFRSYVNGIFQRVERLRLLIDAQPDVTAMRGRHREFDTGGSSRVQGAGTEDRFASFVADLVVLDELDRYIPLLEGDSLTLSKRAVQNTGGVVVAGSTPTSAHGASQICAAYRNSDAQFVWAVKCPGCGELDDLRWERLHWDEDGDPDERGASARYACGSCGLMWGHGKLRRAIEGGAWVEGRYEDEAQFPTMVENGLRVDRGGNLVGPKGGRKTWPKSAGFALMGLNSQWRSWPDAVTEWLKSQGDAGRLRVFVETYLARPWMDEGDRVDHGAVRRQALEKRPDDCRMIVLAVDVQDGWLSAAVFAYGPGEKSVLLERREFNGDVDKVGGAAWSELNGWLATGPRWDGYGITVTAVDTGYQSDMVVRNAAGLTGAGTVLLVKGGTGFAHATWKRGKTVVAGVPRRLYMLGVDGCKVTMVQRYVNGHARVLDSIPDEVLAELEAEELVWAKTLGRKRRRWSQIADRNELLDQSVYALAAVRILGWTDEQIAALEPNAPVRRRKRRYRVA